MLFYICKISNRNDELVISTILVVVMLIKFLKTFESEINKKRLQKYVRTDLGTDKFIEFIQRFINFLTIAYINNEGVRV